ncbi:8387_t:CDS:2 [Entrophospora sp. SA101]|nr:4937_t:CDS:2 [Entrophospora sp. SA101]CAJ0824207.1 19842_t:CDS:2 [Entrophospora sp. SA101]CAJ0831707.1 8387_t:CDS:2 [Entrophospora sp. SA101]
MLPPHGRLPYYHQTFKKRENLTCRLTHVHKLISLIAITLSLLSIYFTFILTTTKYIDYEIQTLQKLQIHKDPDSWLEEIYGKVNISMLNGHTYSQLLNLSSGWKSYLPLSSELTIISIVNDHDNIEAQLNSISNQTIKPENIIIITSKRIVNKIEYLIRKKHNDLIISIYVMDADKLKLLGWLQLAQNIKTTHVLLLDSGVVLGKRFIQNMLHVANTNEYNNALLGTMGAYIKVNGGLVNQKSLVCLADHKLHSNNHIQVLDSVTSSQKVDMLTNIWFFKKLWIPILFRENVLDDAGVPFGFYFTYVLKYHANIPSYILPTHDEESWGDRNSIQQSTCEDLQSKLDNNAIWNNQIEHGYPLVFKESLLKNTELNRILFVIDGYYQEKMFRPLFCRLSLINDNLINVVVTGNSRGMSASKLRSSLVENQYSECKNIEIYDLDIKTDSRNRISRNDDIELKIKVFHGVGRIIQFLKPEVIFYSKIAKDEVIQGITIAANEIKNITKIQLPLDEVHYAIDIIADLPFKALKNWNLPKVQLQVLTQNRPKSLRRLVNSLNLSFYFGEEISLTINMDKGAKNNTISLSNKFKWRHGVKNIKHRVDDVELSPYYYIWTKYVILKYRYGPDREYSKRMYGLSLYNQKQMELPLPGRRKFSADLILNKSKYKSGSPYLCQVPCSWGAVYFPEIWREFHEYLAVRLNDVNNYKIQDIKVPLSRSNFWKESWKKYLIELIYLRGYVMLYPNFSNYTSFSTNHAENGIHIRARKNKPAPGSIFDAPLMNKNIIFKELPGGQLAKYKDLPVLDLWGNLTTFKTLVYRGQDLQSKVSLCPPTGKIDEPTFDPRDLFCVDLAEKRKAMALSQNYSRDIDIMMRVFEVVTNYANLNQMKMGPKKFINIFLSILNGKYAP